MVLKQSGEGDYPWSVKVERTLVRYGLEQIAN
jgi:hypothetical protein